jgi:hypothetical protein
MNRPGNNAYMAQIGHTEKKFSLKTRGEETTWKTETQMEDIIKTDLTELNSVA